MTVLFPPWHCSASSFNWEASFAALTHTVRGQRQSAEAPQHSDSWGLKSRSAPMTLHISRQLNAAKHLQHFFFPVFFFFCCFLAAYFPSCSCILFRHHNIPLSLFFYTACSWATNPRAAILYIHYPHSFSCCQTTQNSEPLICSNHIHRVWVRREGEEQRAA